MNGKGLGAASAIVRGHIVLVAVAATVVFGWLGTGRYLWGVALVTGADWFYVNLLNRVTDLAEDTKNAIPGTEWLTRWRRVLLPGAFVGAGASLAIGEAIWPGVWPWRVATLVIGTAYSIRLVPWWRGGGVKFVRLKEIYFVKNTGSAVLFVLTCVCYPLAVVEPGSWTIGWSALGVLVAFFVPFELSYEVLYDFRDLEGDRDEGIPTYPVVHGPRVARAILDGLLVAAGVALLGGFAARAIGVRELLMLAAPVSQLAFYRPRLARGLTGRDCVLLTHLGTAQLVLYLVGTAAWGALGLPANVWL